MAFVHKPGMFMSTESKRLLKYILLLAVIAALPADAEDNMLVIDSASSVKWGEYKLLRESDSVSLPLFMLELNPEKFEMTILSSQEYRTGPMTAESWADEFDYEIVFNAGLFMRENNLPLGYSKSDNMVLNSHHNRHNSFLLFNPIRKSLPSVELLDRQCVNLDSILPFYKSHLQSIRMLSCRGENCWKKSEKNHSILSLGLDSAGRMTLFFVQEPIVPHEFIEQVFNLKPELETMMYLEGGRHASLYVELGRLSLDMHGFSNNPMPLKSLREMPMPLPIVIGMKRRQTD